tara:strand:+ start:122 stop:637 length:516 start_codon:yes stop_codon:yes gene_type:complete
MEIKSDKFADYMTFSLVDTETVMFNLVKLENIYENIKLLMNKVSYLNKQGIKYIIIEIPTNFTYIKYKEMSEQLLLQKEYNKIIGKYDCKVLETSKPYCGLFECNINHFIDFYKGNLYRLAKTNNVVVISNKQVPDEDGFILVINKKKRKLENKLKFKKMLSNLKKKYNYS